RDAREPADFPRTKRRASEFRASVSLGGSAATDSVRARSFPVIFRRQAGRTETQALHFRDAARSRAPVRRRPYGRFVLAHADRARDEFMGGRGARHRHWRAGWRLGET